MAEWSTDTIVAPDLRGSGIGSRLQKALHESFQICMSLAMTEPNRGIKAKLGARPIQPLPILVRRIKWTPNELASALLRRSPELFRGAFRYGLNHGVGSLFTKVLNLFYKRSLSKFESNIEFTSVRRFGVETHALWERIERNRPVSLFRYA